MKEESIGPPKIYLGVHFRRVQLENGVEAWDFGSSQYVQAVLKMLRNMSKTKTT